MVKIDKTKIKLNSEDEPKPNKIKPELKKKQRKWSEEERALRKLAYIERQKLAKKAYLASDKGIISVKKSKEKLREVNMIKMRIYRKNRKTMFEFYENFYNSHKELFPNETLKVDIEDNGEVYDNYL